MDTIAIYGRWQAIPDVVGRMDYLTNPDRQENLLAVGGECNREFWQRLLRTVSRLGGRVEAIEKKKLFGTKKTEAKKL